MKPFFAPLRPPGAVAEKEFLRRCVRCGKCVHACPWQAVHLAGGWGKTRNTPVIVPRHTPCWLCMKCPPACPTGALDASVTSMEKANMGRAVMMKEQCLNYKGGTMCWTCYDRCPLRGKAIILEDGVIPAITDACVGCGVCEYVCPEKAITTVPEKR